MAEARRSDIFCVVGSSLQVAPVNEAPEVAKNAGAKLIIINHGATPLDNMADLRFFESADKVLEAISHQLS